MSFFDVIIFVLLCGLLAYNVEEWAFEKKPRALSLVVFDSLMLFGFTLHTILEHVSIIVIK